MRPFDLVVKLGNHCDMLENMSQGAQVHIADINFPAFFVSAFDGSLEVSTKFYEAVATPGVYSDAKTILHQTARMLWLADRIDEVAAGRPAFQILLYLTAAELVAQLASKYEGEGESKKHVQHFFSDICASSQKERLQKAFRTVGGAFLSLEATVNFLYRIRCDVVHRGQYYLFSLPRTPNNIPLLTGQGNDNVIAEITLPELRQIVLEGAVLAAKRLAGI
jgi:hypothetical protein